MLQFLTNHWGTLLIGAIVLVVVGLSVRRMYKNKKQSACNCGCASCGSTCPKE